MNLKILKKDELEKKICIVIGTRPGIIKFSPIIRYLEKRKKDYFIIHTGQHYSYEMDKLFLDELDLPEPLYKISNVKNEKYHGAQTAKMLRDCEKVFLRAKPKIVLVGGDANTNLAGALAARKLHIYTGHIEAGLRSNDWRMPEEHNRVIIDHISDFLFAPTENAKRNLIEDNVKGKVFVTGNTIVDAIKQNLRFAERKSNIINELNLKNEEYLILTIHREENVDSKRQLESILKGIKLVSETFNYEIIFPIHPRTIKRIDYFNLNFIIKEIKKLKLINPIGYLDFLSLLNNCKLVLTDSGGIQEESCILRVPCITLRENTERPETVKVGGNYIAGIKSRNIIKAIDTMLSVKKTWINPFGKNPSKKIINIIEKELNI